MSSMRVRLGFLAFSVAALAGSIYWGAGRSRADGPTGAASAEVGESTAVLVRQIFNPIEGRATVLSVRPDGTLVQKGDLVAELSAVELQNELGCQEIVCRSAEAASNAARMNREVAALEESEFKEAAYAKQMAAAAGAVKHAESNLAREEDRVDWSQRMFDKGYLGVAEKVSGDLALQSARFAKESAEAELNHLTIHGKRKQQRLLSAALENARANELAKEVELHRARFTRKKLQDQISQCKVAAPVGGRVKYVGPMGVGAVVHDGQLLLRIVPDQAAGTAAK